MSRLCEERAHSWDVYGSAKLDVRHLRFVRQAPHPVLQIEARGAQSGQIGRYLLRHRLRRTDVERSMRPDLMQELLFGRSGEPAGLADARDHILVVRPELIACLLVAAGDVTVPM